MWFDPGDEARCGVCNECGPTNTFRGFECNKDWADKKKWRYGCFKSSRLSKGVGDVVKGLREREGTSNITARGLMEKLTEKKEEGGSYLMPTMGNKVAGTAPKRPNVYSDGSFKNTRGHFWQVGGAGVWWPGRGILTITEEERSIAEFKEHSEEVDIFDP